MILLRWPIVLAGMLIQSIFLALGQIWANKTRSMLTTIGIVIGVASVTAVIAAMTGLKENILKDFDSLGVNKIWIAPRRPRSGRQRGAPWQTILFTPDQFDGLMEHCPSVARFSRIAEFNENAQYRDQTSEVRTIGIEPAWHQIENRSVIKGRPFTLIDNSAAHQVCLVTPALQDKLRLDRDCIGQRIRLGYRLFTIVGVVEPATDRKMLGGEQDSEQVFIPFALAHRLNRWSMYVFADSRSPEVSEDAQAELRFFLRKQRRVKPGDPDTFHVLAIQKYVDQFKKMAVMMTMIAGGIVGISLLVGGVGIMNIMLVSVSERTREIGLRKAVGARSSAILLQFLVEAIVLCLVGGLIGLGGGQFLTWIMGKIPGAKLEYAYIPLWAVGLSFGFSAVVGIVFGMFPAVKAASLDPIETLRHE